MPNKDIKAAIENSVKDLEKEEAEKIRAKVSQPQATQRLRKDVVKTS